MRPGKVTLHIKNIDLSNLDDDEALINILAVKVSHAFSEKLAPQVVDVAKARAPSRQPAERAFNPRKSSFQKVALLDRLPPSRSNTAERIKRFSSLQAGEREVDLARDAEFFRGTAGKNKGAVPDVLRFRGGAVVGAFETRGGTLKASIKFDGVRREGNRVIATVRAHAPYAWYVHEGFNHVGGKAIAPRKFLVSALANIRTRMSDPSTYEG